MSQSVRSLDGLRLCGFFSARARVDCFCDGMGLLAIRYRMQFLVRLPGAWVDVVSFWLQKAPIAADAVTVLKGIL